jgi:hypothetical protein
MAGFSFHSHALEAIEVVCLDDFTTQTAVHVRTEKHAISMLYV